jgi:transcription initiation factor TFIID subunit 1, fungi type
MAPQRVSQTATIQDEEDARQIAQLLNGENPGSLDDILNRPLEPGEKADDAINFEDISDNDLAEEEEGWGGLWYDGMSDRGSDGGRVGEGVGDGSRDGVGDILGAIIQEGSLPVEGGAVAADGYDFDDLFGDFGDDVNGKDLGAANGAALTFDFVGNGDIDRRLPESSATLSDPARDGEVIGADTNLFRDVSFGSKGKGKSAISIYIPPPAGNTEELLASLWPKFDRRAPPKFTSMLPPKLAQFVGKTPLKPPKPLRPTKISLEIDMDQEKLFRMGGSATTHLQRTPREDAELKGIILTEDPNDKEEDSGDEEGGVALEADHEPIGGISQIDIELACQDWDAMLDAEPLDNESGGVLAQTNKRSRDDNTLNEGDDEWLQAFGISQTPPKVSCFVWNAIRACRY